MEGKTVNGFVLQRQLGVGGMAEVWYAENRIGKKAAVKLLLKKFCSDDVIVARFFNEAKVMVKLEHPNIRQVYDYGEIDERPCIVMEYLDGDDLKGMMKNGVCFSDDVNFTHFSAFCKSSKSSISAPNTQPSIPPVRIMYQ